MRQVFVKVQVQLIKFKIQGEEKPFSLGSARPWLGIKEKREGEARRVGSWEFGWRCGEEWEGSVVVGFCLGF